MDAICGLDGIAVQALIGEKAKQDGVGVFDAVAHDVEWPAQKSFFFFDVVEEVVPFFGREVGQGLSRECAWWGGLVHFHEHQDIFGIVGGVEGLDAAGRRERRGFVAVVLGRGFSGCGTGHVGFRGGAWGGG